MTKGREERESVLRVEKSPEDASWDAVAKHVLAQVPVFFPRWAGLAPELRAFSSELYWVRGEPGLRAALEDEVLEDPLCRVSAGSSAFPVVRRPGFQWWCLEKAFRAGVTDNPGNMLSEALRLVTGQECDCRSGRRLWLELPTSVPETEVKAYCDEVFHNNLIERAEVRQEARAREEDSSLFTAATIPHVHADVGHADSQSVERFDFAGMELSELEALSARRLWALSREELQAVQGEARRLGRALTDVEIEVIAQTWSEHCKHKIFAAEIEVRGERQDLKLPHRVDSLFKTYIRGATNQVKAPYLKSVFVDNAGVINITPELDCAIKVETHNSPSALDPYGGALTGIVGVNRDILGVGLGAQPIANVDVFCVGPLEAPEALPPRLHHPRRILEGVRLGVEHGGNKSGIPTVSGAVVHHEKYLGKPLVFCGTVGVLPADRDLIHKEILPGDRIVMAGGRIGKDGIHGATFSSLEMNEDSPVSAVQLGDPLTQRRVWDFLLEARDQNLFRAVTDNGAGGLSSSIGELATLCGSRGGARMDVSRARTKYPGLRPYELVVSESQERMSFAVAEEKLDRFLDLAARRGVECSVLGEFEDSGKFVIEFGAGNTVGVLDMEFLHDGVPRLRLQAEVQEPVAGGSVPRYGVWSQVPAGSVTEMLPRVLGSPNVRSRQDVVEQYDHEVQARTVRKPYGSPGHQSPGDGATLRLSRSGFEGVALGLGLAPFAVSLDAKVATELAIDEAMRNAVAAGMDPSHAAFIDNFCWPDPLPSSTNPDAAQKLGALVVTCARAYEGSIELGVPFVSGKDSMKNDYRMGDIKISVPPTLLITTMGKVHDVRVVPRGYAVHPVRELAFPGEGRRILWICGQDPVPGRLGLPVVDLTRARNFLAALHELIRAGAIESIHDVSDGGWLSTTAELLLGTGVGARLRVPECAFTKRLDHEPEWAWLFGEPATSFVAIVRESGLAVVQNGLEKVGLAVDVGLTVPANQADAAVLELEAPGIRARWKLSELEAAYGGGA